MMTIESEPSSNDDASQNTGAPAEATSEPWWVRDPTIIAAREEVDRWLELVEQRPVREDDSDAVHKSDDWLLLARAPRGAR